MRRRSAHLVFGLYFGFVLSRVGASDYDRIYGMFTGTDFHLARVILTAILTGALGMGVLKAAGGKTRTGEPLRIKRRPMNRGKIVGGLIFGAGWGLSGACPGTVLAQIGEGKLLGLFSFLGMVAGVWLYALFLERHPSWRS